MSFCRDCLADVPDHATALSGLPLAAPGASSRARQAHHRACRLRRLLRHDREARRPDARRQAGGGRRRQARRGSGGLLYRPHLRHPLGHADVRGQAPLPAGGRGQAEHGEICRGRPRRAPGHARPDAAGRAAVDRRSLSRSFRHRAPARSPGRQGAGAFRARGRARFRHHHLDRSRRQQIPRQDRLRSRQAARLCGARPGRSRHLPGAEAGRLHLRRRRGERGAGSRGTAIA